MTNLSPRLQNRSQLFHDEYKYAIKCQVPFGYVLRGCTHPQYKKSEIRERLGPRFRLLKNSKRLFHECKWCNELVEFTEEEIEKGILVIYRMLNKLYSCKTRIKYTSDNITIYSTDLDHVLGLIADSDASDIIDSVIEANITIPRGTIYRKRSQYKCRIYLKPCRFTGGLRNDLTQFFKTYGPMVNVSNSLEFLLEYTSFQTVERYHFFDTNDEDLAKMLDLVGFKSKVVRIISDKYDTGD